MATSGEKAMQWQRLRSPPPRPFWRALQTLPTLCWSTAFSRVKYISLFFLRTVVTELLASMTMSSIDCGTAASTCEKYAPSATRIRTLSRCRNSGLKILDRNFQLALLAVIWLIKPNKVKYYANRANTTVSNTGWLLCHLCTKFQRYWLITVSYVHENSAILADYWVICARKFSDTGWLLCQFCTKIKPSS